MNLSDAAYLARKLIIEHDLHDQYYFMFNRNKTTAGKCWYPSARFAGQGKIELSEHYVRNNDVETVTNTILHEIAHAIAGPDANHGPDWKRVAREIGCTGDRCTSATIAEYQWVFTCGCGANWRPHHRKRDKYDRPGVVCAKCRGALYWRRYKGD